MIVVGWRKDTNFGYPKFETVKPHAVVNDLLQDLPKLTPGKTGVRYGARPASQYTREHGIRTEQDVLTLHVARPNIARDIEIYKRAIRLWTDHNHERLRYDQLPEELITHKNTASFLDRFKVVEGDEPCCHTILAHLSKDGHYFIHPDISQHRSITPREAARIQSFPDSYFFEGPRTSVFTQIGNAVPPMMARGIAKGIKAQLDLENRDGRESAAGTVREV
jgi:DNA (cytosine-5)-methyltransferase 1